VSGRGIIGNERPLCIGEQGHYFAALHRKRALSCSLSSEKRIMSAATFGLGLKGYSGAVLAGAALLLASQRLRAVSCNLSSEERIMSAAIIGLGLKGFLEQYLLGRRYGVAAFESTVLQPFIGRAYCVGSNHWPWV
jgi:hypothetical protein